MFFYLFHFLIIESVRCSLESTKRSNNSLEKNNNRYLNDFVNNNKNQSLVSVVELKPHCITVLVKPANFHPNTSVRLMYERVNARRKPHMEFLNDPVIHYMDLIRREHRCDLRELPQGRYIVCAEAIAGQTVFESNCCEVNVERMDTRGE